MTKLFELDINVYENISVSGSGESLNLALFKGKATGEYFNGTVLDGGVDTQRIDRNGRMSLSARYILEGTDINGEHCRVFVENNGDFENGFIPRIITDSSALSEITEHKVIAELNTDGGEVIISFFAE